MNPLCPVSLPMDVWRAIKAEPLLPDRTWRFTCRGGDWLIVHASDDDYGDGGIIHFSAFESPDRCRTRLLGAIAGHKGQELVAYKLVAD